MIQADAGDDGDERGDDVGGVEPPTQPHLDDGYVYFLPGKISEGHGGNEFKPGDSGDVRGRVPQLIHHGHKLLVGDESFRVVGGEDAEPFAEIYQVG